MDPRRLHLALAACALIVTCSCGGTAAPAPPTTPSQPNRTVTAITLSGQTLFTAVGQSHQWTAAARYSDGTVGDVTATATWASEYPNIATVSAGLVTAREGGTSPVIASVGAIGERALAAVRLVEQPAEASLGPQQLVGTWRTVNETGAVVGVDVRADGAVFGVRAWGSCVPTACDWGEVTTPLADGGDGRLSLTWLNIATRSVEVRLLKDGRLEFWCHAVYVDGRPNIDSVDYLRRTP